MLGRNRYGDTMQSEPEAAPETPERKNVRRKRFQRGCVRKVKHGRRWVWIGKYREDGIGRTKVLGHCAELTEGGAWAKLQEYLLPLNERAGQRHALPTNFRAYVLNVYLPQRRKKWKDSTDQTTTERIQVAADQRGHAIGVAIDTYTESDRGRFW